MFVSRVLPLLSLVLLPIACAPAEDESMAEDPSGLPGFAILGGDTARSFVEFAADGSPSKIGISFSKSFLEGLPQELDPTNRCFDLDGNGSTAEPGECIGEWPIDMVLPTELTDMDNNVFKWVGFGFNPFGHGPAGVWDIPHFDVHFYLQEREDVAMIRAGSCGFDPAVGRVVLLINCEDSVRAVMPVPDEFMPPGHVNLGVAVPDMGNHLLMPASPEFSGETFTHTFLYGSYDGHITFLEPMLTRDFLLSEPDVCQPINQPDGWEEPGYYPNEYCVRYDEVEDRYTITLEDLELSEGE
jgi:hypothetical protein